MTLQPGSGSERGQRSGETHRDPSLSEDELVEIQNEDSDGGDTTGDRQQGQQEPHQEPQHHPEQRRRTRSTSPAYVAPIPKIGPIPRVSPSPGIQVPATSRPQLPQFVGSYLVGKPVNEFGEIIDEKTGQVLARTGGDLPAMVGRKVSNNQGDVLGDDGELLGYVTDIEIERRAGSGGGGHLPRMPAWPPMMSLAEIMGRSNSSLMVDHLGNILDLSGNVVGKFHDNNNPMHRKEREEQQRQKEASAKSASKTPETPPKSCSTPPPRTAAEDEPEEPHHERQQQNAQNAQSWRKENDSPSDIFLDVKSTTEGIQLTIRIPTVFNGSQVRPTTIQFS